jgi:hypothetical protein
VSSSTTFVNFMRGMVTLYSTLLDGGYGLSFLGHHDTLPTFVCVGWALPMSDMPAPALGFCLSQSSNRNRHSVSPCSGSIQRERDVNIYVTSPYSTPYLRLPSRLSVAVAVAGSQKTKARSKGPHRSTASSMRPSSSPAHTI